MGEKIKADEKTIKALDMIHQCSMYVDCEDCPFEGLCVKFIEVVGSNPMEFKEAFNKYGL